MTDSDSPKSSNIRPSIGRYDPAAEIGQDLFCQGCGYNLRGLTGSRCPECGNSLDTVRITEPQLPWVHRKEQGWFRAYWRTVGWMMFRQNLFCEEMARHVSYGDAQRFRWVTILHVWVPFLIATVVYCVVEAVSPFGFAVIDLAVVFYLVVVTGVPSYFFHPKGLRVDLQNRAIALSYYSSASLSVSALPIASGLSAYLLDTRTDLGLFLWMVAIAVALAQFLAWFLDLTRICRRVMPQFERRVLLVGMCVPILWVAMLGLVLFGIQTIDFYASFFFALN